MAQTHHAVHVLALAVHLVTAPDGILVGNVAVGALVDLLGTLSIGLHVDVDVLGQQEGHHHMVAQTADALVAQTGVVRGAHDGLHALQLVGRQPVLGTFGVEVDEHLVEALAAAVLALAALHKETDGHLRRRLLDLLGGLLLPLGRQVAVHLRALLQLLVVANRVNHLLKTDVLSLVAVECLVVLHNRVLLIFCSVTGAAGL